MPAARTTGYTLILRDPRNPGQGIEFHLNPHPESLAYERTGLSTVIRLGGNHTYREVNGEGIREVVLEGTFGRRKRKVGGVTVTGLQLHEAFYGIFDRYWEGTISKSRLDAKNTRLEFHDWQRGIHYYAEPTRLSDPQASENRRHYKYRVELRLHTKIQRDNSLSAPDPRAVANRTLKALKAAGERLTGYSKQLRDLGEKASKWLREDILKPIQALAKGIEDFVQGVSSIIRLPFQLVNTVISTAADVIDSLGSLPSELAVSIATNVQGIKDSLARIHKFPELFKENMRTAGEELRRAFTDPIVATDSDIQRDNKLYGSHQSGIASGSLYGNRSTTSTRPYAVREGDTLQEIAARQMGDVNRWPEIALLNNLLDSTSLTAGDTLQIPADDTDQVGVVGSASNTDLPTEERAFGRDWRLVQTSRNKLSIVFSGGDIATVSGRSNLEQAIQVSRRVRQGELLWAPTFGMLPLIGRPLRDGQAEALKWALEETSLADPRIADIDTAVDIAGNRVTYTDLITPVPTAGSGSFQSVGAGL